jgi:hypothetical protein
MEDVMIKSEPIDPLIMDLEEEIPLDVPHVNLDLVRNIFDVAYILANILVGVGN